MSRSCYASSKRSRWHCLWDEWSIADEDRWCWDDTTEGRRCRDRMQRMLNGSSLIIGCRCDQRERGDGTSRWCYWWDDVVEGKLAIEKRKRMPMRGWDADETRPMILTRSRNWQKSKQKWQHGEGIARSRDVGAEISSTRSKHNVKIRWDKDLGFCLWYHVERGRKNIILYGSWNTT